ncbi:tetratricopeptide repeat protein [Chryseobacterium koreense]|uniref:Uncharacterized protein n=1 Tax=Chryseobacterium koreense CCUG 49689 TaxID=1304281 RepID=A0A0J7IXV9_9FLAO|nr:hypothetical protein [Chryseobacterium koreense]KMQ70837.1 hypothetical protein ACM44_09380 [Chryseobacterium koreense CCUG 49689]MBB5332521.1 tetratricopeptide (TPR) repeat protein [Chryseobacterium koreense]
MKKIFLSIAVVSMTFALAQKKEISNAVKAIDGGDTATANAQVSAAESVMNGNVYLLEPALQEQYYYAKGLGLVKTGKVSEGAVYLAKINELAKNKIYSGKDASKNRVYYVGKAAADASGIQGLKEETYSPTLLQNVEKAIFPLADKANKMAIDAFNQKNFNLSGSKFKETYYLLKAAGSDDGSILLNAVTAYTNGKNNVESIKIFEELIGMGYTGVQTNYLATNKKSGEQEKMNKTIFDFQKKLGEASEFKDFKVETSPSVEKQIYQNLTDELYTEKRYDEVIKYADLGLKKFPNDEKLVNIKGLAYFSSGKSAEFIEVLKGQVAANPKDVDSWYNLGIMLKSDPAQYEAAKAAFLKAIELNPNYANALQNITFLIMGDDGKAIDDYNEARKSGKIDAANKIMDARKKRFAEALPYAEKWYQTDTTNLDAVTLLKGLYMSTKNDAKFQEFKAKEAALEAAGKK